MKKILGVVLWVVVAVLCRAEEEGGGFVKSRGVQLILNGSPYYGNGFNAYWFMVMASDPSQRAKVTSAFHQASIHGLTLARAWAFSDGGHYFPLQNSPGSYNEQTFKGLDFVVSEARKHGIKLILSLVNNYDEFGGKKQYVEWAKNEGESIKSEDDFFTNDVVKGFYKNHVKSVLTRVNSLSGVAYKDDPTIMAWELMNEPRCSSDPSGNTIQAWITEMASHVKSIDANHLLEAGLEGFYGDSSSQKQQYNPNFRVGTDFIANNLIHGIDFATVHSYPDQWLTNSDDESQMSFLKDWVKVHIQDAQTILHKPVLFTEFGKSWKNSGYSATKRDKLFNTVYSAIYSSASTGGAAVSGMFWQLMTEGMDSYRDGYEVIMTEGPSASTARIIAEQSRRLNRIRKMYARLRNIDKLKRAKAIRNVQTGHGNSGN